MTPASRAPGLPGAPGISRSANAATVAASSSLRNAPWPGPCACAWAVVAAASAALCCACVCASASGTSPAPATAPAPTAVPIRNARRDSSCLLMLVASLSHELVLSKQDAPLYFGRQGDGPAALTYPPVARTMISSRSWSIRCAQRGLRSTRAAGSDEREVDRTLQRAKAAGG